MPQKSAPGTLVSVLATTWRKRQQRHPTKGMTCRGNWAGLKLHGWNKGR